MHRTSRRRKHRLWTAEEKRSICLQTRAAGVSVAQVARRYALNSNLIFKWLKDPRFSPPETIEDAPLFLPVEVSTRNDAPAFHVEADRDENRRIEIVLSSGHSVKIEGPFDGIAVAEVVKALV